MVSSNHLLYREWASTHKPVMSLFVVFLNRKLNWAYADYGVLLTEQNISKNNQMHLKVLKSIFFSITLPWFLRFYNPMIECCYLEKYFIVVCAWYLLRRMNTYWKHTKGRRHSWFSIHLSYSFEGYRKIHEYRRIKRRCFSTHLNLVPLVKKKPRHVNHTDFSEKWNIGGFPYKADFEDF